ACVAREAPAENAWFSGRAFQEQVELPGASKLGVESVSLRRITLELDPLPALHRGADLHAPVIEHPRIDDPIADLELGVAATKLNLQMAVEAAGAPAAVGRDLENHRPAHDDVVRVGDLNAAIDLVRHLRLPASRIAVHLTRGRKPGLNGCELRCP